MNRSTSGLYLHDLFFFAHADLACLLHVPVGQLLEVVLGLVELVLGDELFFLQFAQIIQSVAATVADGDLGLLDASRYLLRQLLAALLGQAGDGQANQPAVVGRGESQVGLEEGFLDSREGGRVPGADG